MTRFAIASSDGVTAISSYLREETVREFDVTRPIEVIPNFVNCDLYQPLTPEVCAAGRLRYARRRGKAVAAPFKLPACKTRSRYRGDFRKRSPSRCRHRLLLVGDGPERSNAEYRVHELGLQDRVHFLGKQDEVHQLLPLADLLLMPSKLEAFGLVALEAAACRVPTISTRQGGVPELIEDGVNGRLLPVGDIDGNGRGRARAAAG